VGGYVDAFLNLLNKDHAETIGDLPDEYLRDIGPVVKKIALATGVEQYNVVQVCSSIRSSQQ
jgi:diadenosine tetraphosphate (Ap4A) HIT family hydrolase